MNIMLKRMNMRCLIKWMRKMEEKEVKEKRMWESVEGVDGMIAFFKRNEVSCWRDYDNYECIHTKIESYKITKKNKRERNVWKNNPPQFSFSQWHNECCVCWCLFFFLCIVCVNEKAVVIQFMSFTTVSLM